MSNFRKYINPKRNEKESQIDEADQNTVSAESTSIDSTYYNTLNPDTGLRYDIPMLSPLDPGYYFKYIYYMKLKERSPETFAKLTNWE